MPARPDAPAGASDGAGQGRVSRSSRTRQFPRARRSVRQCTGAFGRRAPAASRQGHEGADAVHCCDAQRAGAGQRALAHALAQPGVRPDDHLPPLRHGPQGASAGRALPARLCVLWGARAGSRANVLRVRRRRTAGAGSGPRVRARARAVAFVDGRTDGRTGVRLNQRPHARPAATRHNARADTLGYPNKGEGGDRRAPGTAGSRHVRTV